MIFDYHAKIDDKGMDYKSKKQIFSMENDFIHVLVMTSPK